MEHPLKESIRPLLYQEIFDTVNELDLTSEKAAEILGIELRTFTYLKSGKTMCSTTTLLIYLSMLCKDTNKFILKVKEIIKKSKNQ